MMGIGAQGGLPFVSAARRTRAARIVGGEVVPDALAKVCSAHVDTKAIGAHSRELRRVLNRGEAVNALERAIYSGRVNPMQARRSDDMHAVADALSLLANIVMA